MTSFKKSGGRYGMHSGNGRFKNLQVDNNFWVQNQLMNAANTPGAVYYVDRNHNLGGSSGDGSSWDEAFLTITEAINAVNADYTGAIKESKGRNAVIFIAEGYYSEVPVTLTASDVTMICTAPGSHDSTVFYGSATAGGWDAGTTAPAITISGDNNTIYGLGIVNLSNNAHPAVRFADGGIANHLINCKITKNAADEHTYGIEDLGGAYNRITGCEFTISSSTAGIRLYSATNNSIQIIIEDCIFYGGPTGILVDAAAHMAMIKNCIFVDDTSDTAETMDTPILNNGGASLIVRDCYSQKTTANLVTGAGTSYEANNFQLA
jgi:hypothetical protein